MKWLVETIFNKLGLTTENAIRFREWSKGKILVQIPLWIMILWMLGFANPYWCVYPVCLVV